MLFSAAYAAMVGTLVPLLRPGVAVISDELNHNCIIQAIRLARPEIRLVYPHNDLAALERSLEEARNRGALTALVVTDGVFSMRGDLAPLPEIQALIAKWDPQFPEGAWLVVDDSHGVGALGSSGRGSEEELGARPAEVLVGTLGKAFCVNGGYVVAARDVIDYLRETAPTYIYSNPITAGEAAAALRSLELLDSPWGRERLALLRNLTDRFRRGLVALGWETVPGVHPVVPLLVRDTARTTWLVRRLFEAGILATGLNYPVVPRGQETIRFQVNADHTPADIDYVLDVLAKLGQDLMKVSG
jgi:glycine C-acetyltransferase